MEVEGRREAACRGQVPEAGAGKSWRAGGKGKAEKSRVQGAGASQKAARGHWAGERQWVGAEDRGEDGGRVLGFKTSKPAPLLALLTCPFLAPSLPFSSRVRTLPIPFSLAPFPPPCQVDETDLSPLFTALGISCIVSGTPSGWVVDRFPTHYVLIGSLLVEVSAGAQRR